MSGTYSWPLDRIEVDGDDNVPFMSEYGPEGLLLFEVCVAT